MALLTLETKQCIKRAARCVGLLGMANRVEYAYGNRINRETLDFYRMFVPDGSLCFDIGAHYGAKTRLFRRLGATVVAVEPLSECGDTLRTIAEDDDKVILEPAACGKTETRAVLYQSPLNPQNSTLSRDFADSWGYKNNFGSSDEVIVVTLDSLIAKYGLPAFCKIDTEGHDADVLQGLRSQIPTISFEFHGWNHPTLAAGISRLSELDYRYFNYVLEPSYHFGLESWGTGSGLLEEIRDGGGAWCGNVFARVDPLPG